MARKSDALKAAAWDLRALLKPLLLQPFFPGRTDVLLLTGFADLYNSTNKMVAWKRREEPRQAVPRSD
jgi:hypothetical protein